MMMNSLNMYIQQAVMIHYHWLHYTAVVHKRLSNNTKKITKLVTFFTVCICEVCYMGSIHINSSYTLVILLQSFNISTSKFNLLLHSSMPHLIPSCTKLRTNQFLTAL